MTGCALPDGETAFLPERLRRCQDVVEVWEVVHRAGGGQLPTEPEVLRVIAEHTPCFDARLLVDLLDPAAPCTEALLRNPAFSGRVAEQALEVLAKFLEGDLRRERGAGGVCQMMRRLRSAGLWSGHHPVVGTLVRLLVQERRGHVGEWTALLDLLLECADLPAAQILHLMQRLAWNETARNRLLLHPAATPEVWRLALGSTWSESTLAALLAVEAARREPWIRSLLVAYARFRSPGVYVSLAADAEAPEFASFFREVLASSDPECALEMLEGAGPEQLRELAPPDLAPLLAHPKTEVRSLALCLLPRLQGETAPTGPEVRVR